MKTEDKAPGLVYPGVFFCSLSIWGYLLDGKPHARINRDREIQIEKSLHELSVTFLKLYYETERPEVQGALFVVNQV